MNLFRSLSAAGLGVFPCVIRYDDKKKKWQKAPRTVERESWMQTALRSPDDPRVAWAGCTVAGVHIPDGVVVVDLDLYKAGCTTAAVDAALGVSMPWPAALVQTTVGGGAHYAFRVPAGWAVRQTSSAGGVAGFDTRTHKGFICTGEGYTPQNTFGVLRLAHPESLPVLPDGCRAVLEDVAHEAPAPRELPQATDRDVPNVIAALHHIDPTERDTWRNIGFALKHYFHDDDDTGYSIWDAWSRGDFSPNGTPDNYNAESQPRDWAGFRAVREGNTITVGWLFGKAMTQGWRPPARLDTAAAFGAGAVAADVFDDLVRRVLEGGADSRNTGPLLEAIAASGCNDMQALLLRNELKAQLRGARLLDKALSALIDRATNPAGIAPDTTGSGMYGKNHTENAEVFLTRHYPDGELLRTQEVWYTYTGKAWSELEDAAVDHALTRSMQSSRPQKSTVNGTYQTLCSLCYDPGVSMNRNGASVVLYQNGALDLYTGALLPHSRQYLTTKLLPYNYAPHAVAPRWLAFLDAVFEGDAERIALLQEWFGYMLSPTYEHHKVMLLLGPPRCGKGTIGRVLQALVGDQNYSGCSLASFAKDDFLDAMRNVTVAFSGDTAKTVNRSISETVTENIKKISGGDSVGFCRKYKSHMTCTLPTRITLAGNHIPRLFDDSGALVGRLLVIPFDVSFARREDPALTQALLSEIEGVNAWALAGLARLNATRAFTQPEAAAGDLQRIAEAYSPLSQFITTRCLLGEGGLIRGGELYDVYRAWAVQEGEEYILPRKTFTNAFTDATRGRGARYGPHRDGDVVFRGFSGVSIIQDNAPATASAFKLGVVK